MLKGNKKGKQKLLNTSVSTNCAYILYVPLAYLYPTLIKSFVHVFIVCFHVQTMRTVMMLNVWCENRPAGGVLWSFLQTFPSLMNSEDTGDGFNPKQLKTFLWQ